MNKKSLIILFFSFLLSFSYSQNIKLSLNVGTVFKKKNVNGNLFQNDTPLQGIVIDGNVFFRNNSAFIHGPDLAYMLFFKNNDYLDNYYLEKRQSVFPQEIWLPDSIIHMTNAHQFSLNYNLGLDKRFNENHFLLFYIGFGGMMYKLPERIDKFNNLTYFWKNSLFGLNSNINIGYGYKFQNNIAIQISYELNFAYLFKESYDNYNEVNRSIFQLAYMLKLGIAKYF